MSEIGSEAPPDPPQVRVLAVGLEAYEDPSFAPLAGVGAHAVAFAEWAVSCDIPAEQVSLAVTWDDKAAGQAEFERLAALGYDLVEGGTRDSLQTLILKGRSADVLLLYWAGHGVLNETYDRVVFAGNTIDGSYRFLGVPNIQNALRTRAGPARQLLFIDACANFVGGTGLRGPLRDDTFGLGSPNPDVSQWTLYSAAQGVYAGHSAETRTTFSGILLDWLSTQQTVLVDFDKALAHITEQIKDVTANPGARDFPVMHVVDTPRSTGKASSYGGFPVSGTEKRSIDKIALSIRQVRDLRTLASDHGVDEDALRQALIRVLEADPTDDGGPTSELIADVISRRRRGRLVTELTPLMGSESALVFKAAWERHEMVARLVAKLGRVHQDQLRDAYYRAVPGAQKMLPDLDAALGQAADRGPDTLVRMVVAIETLSGQLLPVSAFGDLADESELTRIRNELGGRPPPSGARLVIALADDGSATWPGEVSAFVRPPDADFLPATVEACEPTEAGVRAVVAKRIAEMRDQFGTRFSIGFLVPRRVMEESSPEGWTLEPTTESAGGPIWHLWPTCLHLGERRRKKAWETAWSEAAARIEAALDGTLRLGWLDEADDEVAFEESTVHCLAFREPLVARKLGGDSLIRSADLGAPYVFWAHEPPDDWADTVAVLEKLIEEGAFADIPRRLNRERRRQSTIAENLRLVWDDPRALPEPGRLPART